MDEKIKNLPHVMFVTGIGTDVGKSFATGWLARELARCGRKVITQKFVQTGNHDMSEDIETHRRIMGIPLQERDLDHTTAPLILSYPCSPDLAQKIDGMNIDWSVPGKSTDRLLEEYDTVLIEGAGGVLVPLTGEYLTADYIADSNLPAALVTGGTLGSINHTLLSLEALTNRKINITAVIYNPFFDKDEVICADTRDYIRRYIKANLPGTVFLEMPTEV